MSKVTVYWSSGFPSDQVGIQPAIGLITPRPKKLSLYLKDILPQDKKNAAYLRCPSIVQEIKRYYTINSPIDYSFSWDKGNTWTNDSDQKFFDNFVLTMHESTAFLGIYYSFFCEEDLEMTIYPPFLHSEDILRDALVLPGALNIGKWVRSIHPAFIYKKESGTIKIKENRPLFYIKFSTDKEIVFKEFDYNTKISKLIANGQNISRVMFPGRRLEFYYKMFSQYRLRGLLLKSIKENLIE